LYLFQKGIFSMRSTEANQLTFAVGSALKAIFTFVKATAGVAFHPSHPDLP
jgi:hypothetical protein